MIGIEYGFHLFQLPKVNSDLKLDNFLLAIENIPFVKKSGTYTEPKVIAHF